jgi:hypothetical protein
MSRSSTPNSLFSEPEDQPPSTHPPNTLKSTSTQDYRGAHRERKANPKAKFVELPNPSRESTVIKNQRAGPGALPSAAPIAKKRPYLFTGTDTKKKPTGSTDYTKSPVTPSSEASRLQQRVEHAPAIRGSAFTGATSAATPTFQQDMFVDSPTSLHDPVSPITIAADNAGCALNPAKRTIDLNSFLGP